MNLLTGSMTPEQFQQYQQEQQQAFFRWQQSQILNRDLDNLQQNPPSFHSESSQTLTQPQQVDSPKKGGRKKKMARKGKNVEDEPQEPVAAGRWLPVEKIVCHPPTVRGRSEDIMSDKVTKSMRRFDMGFERVQIRKNFNRTKDMLDSKWHTFELPMPKVNRRRTNGPNVLGEMAKTMWIFETGSKEFTVTALEGSCFPRGDAWAFRFHPKGDANP
ncbi:hypothetical protein Tco_1206920 [Tanacetum coccineum]